MVKTLFPLGSIMKAARKFKHLNQAEVARAMGCSQSALSKMEHNQLIPSAVQWFLFSRFTSIPPESLETGVIDRHIKMSEQKISSDILAKIPKRYRLNPGEKMREVYPLLIGLKEKIDHKSFKKFQDSLGFDVDYFLDFDNVINFQLIIDIINLFIHHLVLSDKDVKEIALKGQNLLYWDQLHFEGHTIKKRIEHYCLDQDYFQSDFALRIKEQGDHLRFSYLPNPSLYSFLKDLTAETIVWLSTYRKYTLENMIQRFSGQTGVVIFLPELSRSPLEQHFDLSLVSYS